MAMKPKLTAAAILLGGVLVGVLAGAFLALSRDLPQIRSLEDFQPEAATRIYSADDILLTELYVARRHPVALERIPAKLKQAVIITEDRKFYHHSGVDLKGVARALVKNVLAGEFVEGASTITQQLAKTLFLTPRKTLVRKLKEALLAFQLERRYTKDEILALYLNQIYLGSGAYGVEAASQIFFGKPLDRLSLSECALIAAMPRSPSRYSPRVNPALAVKRRNIVLRLLHANGMISDLEYQAAVAEPLQLAPDLPRVARAPYFVEYVKDYLEQEIGSARLYGDGLIVRTTLDYGLQQAAEKAVARGLEDLAGRMRRKQIAPSLPQAALIALEVPSGNILAMVGGRDFRTSPFNRATDAKRQPGSAFKPFVFGCAIENGFAQDMLVLDAPVAYRGVDGAGQWQPRNFSPGFHGEMTIRRALALSQNIPAVRLIEKLGPQAVIAFARRLGVEAALVPDLTLALGTSEMTLVELVKAYAVFPNRGELVSGSAVGEVVDRHGRVIWQTQRRRRVAMSRSGAAIVTDMLSAVIREGTGSAALSIRRPIAGKTGTSADSRDALFVGFSPSVAAGVWVGQDAGDTLGSGETGARAALPIWIDFMTAALHGMPPDYFDIPDGVVARPIDPIRGEPLGAGHPGAVQALFRKEARP